MTPDDNDALWRNRFILLNLTRIGGTLVVLVGLFLWQTDAIQRGGAVAIGLPMAIIGLVVSFYGPRWLARRWRTLDGR
jgi:hypothetical protein